MDQIPETETIEQPRVSVCIPTGVSKSYALSYMVAALEQLEWDNLELHWAVTDTGHIEMEAYALRIKTLMQNSLFKHPWTIHMVHITEEQRLIGYAPVVANKKHLRDVFLDGDAEYFFMVGGDNPPYRTGIKRLMRFNKDVAFGASWQRPARDAYNPAAVYPMVWTYAWTMKDIERYHFEPRVKAQFRKAFLNGTLYIPLHTRPNWRRLRRLDGAIGGDGNCLIKRRVVENVPWILPGEWRRPGTTMTFGMEGGGNPGYHSEDLHWFNNVTALGYSTVCDLRYRVMHMHDDGSVY